MGVQMVLELTEERAVQPVFQAIESYRIRLLGGIERTRRRLSHFEQRYSVDTAHFMQEWAAEDLDGGDIEYVEWAGEARLLEGLKAELSALDYARNQFS